VTATIYAAGLVAGSPARVYAAGVVAGSPARVYAAGVVAGSPPRIYSAGIAAGTPPRIYAAGITATSTSIPFRVHAAGLVTVLQVPRFYAGGMVSTGAAIVPVVSPIPASTVDGWTPVTITGVSIPAADSWQFTVTSGGVTLTGSGATVAFTAPAVFNGVQVRIQVVAVRGGLSSVPQVAVVTVKPWSSFVLAATGWVPRRPLQLI
jgi:hypothetical protein